MRRYVLAVDVGNSRVKLGLFERIDGHGSVRELPACILTHALRHDEDLPWQDLQDRLAPGPDVAVDGVIAGTNPDGVQRVIAHWPRNVWPLPRQVGAPADLQLEVRVPAPEKVGIDRLLNAVAANVIRPAQQPAIVVDTGTATTIDAVSPDGAFEGGAILPGFELAARSLHQYTALLPLISVDELSGQPREPLGTDTRGAIRSGLYWGHTGAIRELVDLLSKRWSRQPMLLLTGGGAGLMADQFPQARWEPNLSLQGLYVAGVGCR